MMIGGEQMNPVLNATPSLSLTHCSTSIQRSARLKTLLVDLPQAVPYATKSPSSVHGFPHSNPHLLLFLPSDCHSFQSYYYLVQLKTTTVIVLISIGNAFHQIAPRRRRLRRRSSRPNKTRWCCIHRYTSRCYSWPKCSYYMGRR